MRRPDPGGLLLAAYLVAVVLFLALGSLLMGCGPADDCIKWEKILASCHIERRRTATQPRFCTDRMGQPDSCWEDVEVCQWYCSARLRKDAGAHRD